MSDTPVPAVVEFPLLGLDISERRIGVALAGTSLAAPRPLFTYPRITRARDLSQCAEWAVQYACKGIVIGLPLNMDGTPGSRVTWMRRFTRHLQQLVAVPVWLQDERLTTVEAEEIFRERGLRREEREAQVDALAAALILERFLQEHA
ncbi:MAG: putative Holliday junction resolvase [bacterium ADurb.Bin429]|nr:MAG: putative Holliday junction resolvase [bacterium ADurb.Bin429]